MNIFKNIKWSCLCPVSKRDILYNYSMGAKFLVEPFKLRSIIDFTNGMRGHEGPDSERKNKEVLIE